MLRAAIVFLIIALIAAIFGFAGVAGTAAEIGRILVYFFVALAVISFIIGLATGGRAGGGVP